MGEKEDKDCFKCLINRLSGWFSGEYKRAVAHLWFIFGILLGWVILLLWQKNLVGLGVMAAIVLGSSIIMLSTLSDQGKITDIQIREAITLVFIFIFLGLLTIGKDIIVQGNATSTYATLSNSTSSTALNGGPIFISKDSVLAILLDKFWFVLSTIIVFYFGGKTVESAIKLFKGGH